MTATSVVVLAPLLIGIAVAVRLESGGPVFTRYRRIGKDGQPFELLKFRTITNVAIEDLAVWPAASDAVFRLAPDPRVTRLGRYLRMSALDELPQLLNVLRGDMTLVGPRPRHPGERSPDTGAPPRPDAMAPGMVGPWAEAGRLTAAEWMELDDDYTTRWSVWRDLKILLRIVPLLFRESWEARVRVNRYRRHRRR